MEFRVLGCDATTGARRGEIVTSRGVVRTPVFMPVATRAAIRALGLRDFAEIGFDIILSNTYHLYLRPGIEVLEKAGGLHRFMNFERPILTDSGGFQVFSLSSLRKLHDHGVEFRSHIDGSRHLFTPRTVLDIQRVIGSDIMMVLDHCAEYPVSEKAAREAVERTVDWAVDSYAYWRDRFDTRRQALFAIVQGSVFGNLRVECAERLCEMDFPGFAIGGLSVGEPKELYREMTAVTLSRLPGEKPRYMMGVGSPLEILDAIEYGVDMFDCVMPTRIARNGTLYTSSGRINIKASRYESDFEPLDARCSCYVCTNFSRAYLRHLFRAGEIAAFIYNTHHNLYFMKNFMDEIGASIGTGDYPALARRWREAFEGI
ncbi:MAG: tRNA guanosine(34) transglycosylase Tgt [Spirochaetes bacterium]|jgi:queuine tRNA-ribosyltransferase|nr:tRNA guanosine(34) transglycosylase Tgt [Spirochaetota bacterium]